MKRLLLAAFAALLALSFVPVGQAYQTAEQSYLNIDSSATPNQDNFVTQQVEAPSENPPAPAAKPDVNNDKHNGAYVGLDVGYSFSNWDKTFNSTAYKDVFATDSFINDISKKSGFALRPTLGYDFLDYFGVEMAYDYFGSSKWSADNDGGTGGSVAVSNIKQSAVEVMGKLRYSIDNFEPYVMAGPAYVFNKGFDEHDATLAPSTDTHYKGSNYITLAMGAGLTYYMPGFENFGLNLQWVGLLGKSNVNYTSEDGSNVALTVPTRNTFMLGLSYKF